MQNFRQNRRIFDEVGLIKKKKSKGEKKQKKIYDEQINK